MSDKGKARRAAYEARQEEKAKFVVKAIIGCLIAASLAYLIYMAITLG